MSADRLAVEIDRIVIHGAPFSPAAANRLGERVRAGLANALIGASWPDESRRTTMIALPAPAHSGEQSLADGIVAAVLQAVGAAKTSGAANE